MNQVSRRFQLDSFMCIKKDTNCNMLHATLCCLQPTGLVTIILRTEIETLSDNITMSG